MRQAQKAWVWSSIPAYTAGCSAEAAAAAKAAGDPREQMVLKGRSRSLLPRT